MMKECRGTNCENFRDDAHSPECVLEASLIQGWFGDEITRDYVKRLISESTRLRAELEAVKAENELLRATQAACDSGSCEFDGCQKQDISGYRTRAKEWIEKYHAALDAESTLKRQLSEASAQLVEMRKGEPAGWYIDDPATGFRNFSKNRDWLIQECGREEILDPQPSPVFNAAKTLPDKLPAIYQHSSYAKGYVSGWNDCIDKASGK